MSSAVEHGVIWFECDAPNCLAESPSYPDEPGNCHTGTAWREAEKLGWTYTLERLRKSTARLFVFRCPKCSQQEKQHGREEPRDDEEPREDDEDPGTDDPGADLSGDACG